MIGQVTGTIKELDMASVLIDVGGIGYIVYTTPDSISTLRTGKKASLWTHLAVREQSLDLYGFVTKDELHFFELLLSVSGIGPKSALGILSVATIETLRSAIIEEDSSYLTKVSGIGRKTAEKIVLELREKVGAKDSTTGSLKGESEALEALMAMGYSVHEARDALRSVPKEITLQGDRLREALKNLGSVL